MFNSVVPAQAGTMPCNEVQVDRAWIPACAGTML